MTVLLLPCLGLFCFPVTFLRVQRITIFLLILVNYEQTEQTGALDII